MAKPSNTPPGSLESQQPGFPREILGTKLEGKYLCCDCKNILRKPYQAQCGHRYCSYCLKGLLRSGPQDCAECLQEDIYEESSSVLEARSAFPDNAARREVEGLPVICNNEGCLWKGTIKEYEANHEGQCEFMLIPCQACKGMIKLNEKERHMERECPERKLNCKYCKVLCYFPEIKAHDEVCPKFPMTCEGCGKRKIPREKLLDHTKGCGKYKWPCKFSVVGCTEIVENEKVTEHDKLLVCEHLSGMLQYITGKKTNWESYLSPNLQSYSHQEDLLFDLQGKPNQLACLVPLSLHAPFIPPLSSSSLEKQIQNEKSQVMELQKRCESLEQKTVTFENIVCVLNREVERASITIEAYSRQHRLDQERIESLNSKLTPVEGGFCVSSGVRPEANAWLMVSWRELDRNIGVKDLHLAEMEQKLLELESTIYDGIFIWKIHGFAKKRQDAVAGRAPAMFSPAFYTNKYGYKMCLRIYLNGDGTGRGTHLSLFFVVMKGANDALLRWPFNQKVTLMLLDQNNREHIIDAFRPDVASNSFQRPVSEMNIASGCPLFCPLSKLESKNSYVREDTIFIKAIVDLTGLS
uniref:TNF receptor-associated factor n=1 Tax=Latimeria chalumnae TaxID=7897 RepID=H3ANY5_LATCH